MNVLGLKVTVEPATTRRAWLNRIIAVGALNAVVLGGGVAYAYWTTTGSGSGSSGSTTAKTVVLSTAGVAAPADLYPGGAGAVAVKVDNTVVGSTSGNSFGVTFDKVTAISVTSTDTTNCPSANVVSNVTLPYSLSSTVVVGANTSTTASIPALVKMLNTAPDGCQGKTFNVSLTLTGTSN